MKIAVAAEVTSKNVRDPKHHYVIDFASLQSAFKKSDLTIEYYDSGALKSINTSAEDRTGEVISSVVTSLGKIVGAGVDYHFLLQNNQ